MREEWASTRDVVLRLIDAGLAADFAILLWPLRFVHVDPVELPFRAVDPLLLEREVVPLDWFFAGWWPFFCHRDPLADRDPFAACLAEGRESAVRRAIRALPEVCAGLRFLLLRTGRVK